MKQTILGAGGAIGTELAKALKNYSNDFRLVSRNPKKINSDDELIRADLSDASQVEKSVEGSGIVYIRLY
jgi:putative NADH-flavin reductase